MSQTYVAIMAGGVGSRFWPASREARPKQFLDILGTGRSLLQQTYERFLGIAPPERIVVVTNDRYRDQVAAQLPDLRAGNILCEPSRNNTAPSVAYTALYVRALDPEATLVVAPSDHVILREAEFLEAVREGAAFAKTHHGLVTLGIEPTRPDTGYGYIEYAATATEGRVHAVAAFREKPDAETAEGDLARGGFVWNAGIFIWTVADVLEAYRRHSPQILEVLTAEADCYGTSRQEGFIAEAYPQTERISVDYAILERARNVYTIPVDIGWSDLGTWGSLHAFARKDDRENVINGANTVVLDASGNMIHTSDGKLVVIRGLRDYIVVDEDDVLMIYPKDQEQEIKKLTQDLSDERFL